MAISRKSANVLVAGLLTLSVVAAGLVGYQAKIQADTVTPGYATAKIIMQVSVPKASEMSVNVKFTPESQKTDRFYFKNRSFVLKPGVNLVSWFVKKIPGGSYSVSINSDLSAFAPSNAKISLISEKVADSEKFIIDLGLPAVSEQITATPANTTTATTKATTSPAKSATATSSAIAAPPVPSLDMTATTNPQTAPTETDDDVPEIPTLPS